MRNVAVTEGDKVQAEIQLGWTVDYWPVGDLVEVVDAVSGRGYRRRVQETAGRIRVQPAGQHSGGNFESSVRYQLREYLGIK